MKTERGAGTERGREHLLDLISTTKETVGPDTRAQMIQLQARSDLAAIVAPNLTSLVVEPVSIIAGPGTKYIILAQNRGLDDILDSATRLVEEIAAKGMYQNAGWRIMKRGVVTYEGERAVYDCLAIKTGRSNATQDKGGSA